ncbi:MAG: tRNA lysidine(34) synthetase TilS [Alphaproteobacteria bacterium]|nr:tRNA lysidine(34) synthetase TilS [Alphaproteobacteria bacterium]MDE2112738.1 tRNA lysidine(34) synthetase TilS [Alphaproteobacteria bacterium]MDE2493721.1 tRNA lysidine(34) synthetase TilS [Alphaproteobacteria bacterium]
MLAARFAKAMRACGAPWPGAVAVSGGSDSLALMFLLRDWTKQAGFPLPVVLCVNHALRPESAAEARQVSRWAKEAGLKVRLLKHEGKVPVASIEAAARGVRYQLMGAWAKRNGLKAVYVGHTQDDQAETFLLRLARGSGVDGLSAMHAVAPYPVEGLRELRLVRPLLTFERESLRDYLRSRDHAWLDDPMNDDPRFSRVKVRKVWPALEAAGLSKTRIADAAAHLARARAALDTVSEAVLARACRLCEGGVLLDSVALTKAPREVGLRALAMVLMTVSGSPYRPRFEKLERLFDNLAEGKLGGGRTLHCCRIAPASQANDIFGRGSVHVKREEFRSKARKNKG